MQKIPLRLAQPDMVLAKPVTRENGMTLVGAGTTLSGALLSKLESMGIETVVVEGEVLDSACGAEAYTKKMERLEHLFRACGGDPYMQRIKGVLGEYYSLKCMTDAALGAVEK